MKPRVLKVDLPGDPERESEFELDCLAEMTVEERYERLFEMQALARELMQAFGTEPPRPPEVVKRP